LLVCALIFAFNAGTLLVMASGVVPVHTLYKYQLCNPRGFSETFWAPFANLVTNYENGLCCVMCVL